MGAIAFYTLQYARKLKKAGVPDSQAEAQAEIMRNLSTTLRHLRS